MGRSSSLTGVRSKSERVRESASGRLGLLGVVYCPGLADGSQKGRVEGWGGGAGNGLVLGGSNESTPLRDLLSRWVLLGG